MSKRLYPRTAISEKYKMPDYEWVHREMQKSGVTLSLLWVEYCEQCRAAGELPYQSTQFNKYYAEYVHKTKATMHLDHKPGEALQVDWAGTTAHVLDTSTGELLDAYLFVAVLPYSGYAYALRKHQIFLCKSETLGQKTYITCILLQPELTHTETVERLC